MKSITVCPSRWDELERNTIERGLPFFPTKASSRAVLLLHECGHIVFRSDTRKGTREHMLWVEACDNAINEFVVDVFRMPPFNYRGDKLDKLEAAMNATGSYQKRFHGMTAEEIYEILKKERDDKQKAQKDPSQKQKPGEPPPEGGDPQPGEGDPEEQEGEGDPSEQPGEGDESEGGDDGSGGSGNGTDISEMFGNDFGDAIPESGIPDDLGELVENAMKDYAERHGDKLHSPNGSATTRELSEAAKKPPVLLSEILRKIRDVVQEVSYSYRRVGKNDTWGMRQGLQMRMPAPSNTPSSIVKELCIVVDASGSMSDEELACANRIINDAFKHVRSHKVRRLVFTSSVVEDVDLTPITKAPIHHTGGTCISSIIDYMEKPTLNQDVKRNNKPIKPSAIILITDGYDSPDSIKRFESWKHLGRLRTILIKNPNGVFPGVVFHADVVG
jgi:predicted metal-dependent peptidase